DGHGKGEKNGKDENRPAAVEKSSRCRPSIEVELRGTVAAAPTATTLAVVVTKTGGDLASLAGKQLSFDLTGARVDAGLVTGTAVQVKGRACVDLVAGTAKLVAERVEAKRGDATTTT